MNDQNGKYDASAWQLKTADLPLSKGVVLVQEIDVLSMLVVKDGSIPDTLQHFLRDKFIEPGKPVAIKPPKTKAKAKAQAKAESAELWEQMPELVPFVDIVCRAALLKPRIVDVIENPRDEILIGMLPLADRMIVFEWVFDQMGDMKALVSFRGKQPGSVFAGRDGATLRDAAE